MAKIGVFDSGMGGLSVLKDMLKVFPHEEFIYLADTKNVPYGPKSEEEIRRCSFEAANILVKEGVKAIAIACNTATAMAEKALDEALDIPVIGIEPELRGAVEVANGKKVFALATAATLKSKRFENNRLNNCPDAVIMPCPELVLMVERGVVEGEEPEAFFKNLFKDYTEEEMGAIVLGCTHFPFMKRPLEKLYPSVPQVNGNARLIARLKAALEERGDLKTEGEGGYELRTSSENEDVLARMKMLMEVKL